MCSGERGKFGKEVFTPLTLLRSTRTVNLMKTKKVKQEGSWLEQVVEAVSREPRDHRVVVMLTKTERETLDSWCEQTGLSQSEFARGCMASQGVFDA